MSFDALKWAMKQDVSDPLAKLLLLVLANAHNDSTGQCNPSLAVLCRETKLGERTVLYKLNLLRNAGLIETRRNYRHASGYVLRPFIPHEMQDKPASAEAVIPHIAASCGAPRATSSLIETGNRNRKREAGAKRPPAADRGTRIPDDFKPDIAVAIAEGLTHQQAARSAANFCDYWKAKPGAAGRKLDWAATWRVWCRREAERRPNGPAPRWHESEKDENQKARDAIDRIIAAGKEQPP